MEGGAIAMAEVFGVFTLSRTMRQQGWLGKAAAGLRAVQGAAARAGEPQAPWTAVGVLPLSGGRLPAGPLASGCPMQDRYRVGGAVWCDHTFTYHAPAGLAGKSGSRAARSPRCCRTGWSGRPTAFD